MRQFKNWIDAAAFAQAEANRRGRIMRLKAVNWYDGARGWAKEFTVTQAVQDPEKRFGTDAEGEFYAPRDKCKSSP